MLIIAGVIYPPVFDTSFGGEEFEVPPEILRS